MHYFTMESEHPIELLDDIVYAIVKFIYLGSAFKSLTLVSKQFSVITSQAHPTAKSKFANHLLTLMELFPTADWNYNDLSANPNTAWEIVRDNPTHNWNYLELSANPNITWEIVRDNPTCAWNYYE